MSLDPHEVVQLVGGERLLKAFLIVHPIGVSYYLEGLAHALGPRHGVSHFHWAAKHLSSICTACQTHAVVDDSTAH